MIATESFPQGQRPGSLRFRLIRYPRPGHHTLIPICTGAERPFADPLIPNSPNLNPLPPLFLIPFSPHPVFPLYGPKTLFETLIAPNQRRGGTQPKTTQDREICSMPKRTKADNAVEKMQMQEIFALLGRVG